MNRAERALRGVACGACVALMLAPAFAAAQPSTDRVARSGWTTDITGGVELWKYNSAASGNVLGLAVGERLALHDSPVGLTGNVFLLHRSVPTGPGPQDDLSHRVLAVALAVDVEVALQETVSIAPRAGLGLAPYVHASREQYSSSNFTQTSSGTVWTLGLTIRVKRLLVQQHFIGLLGAENTIQTFREYYPLMVGWRF